MPRGGGGGVPLASGSRYQDEGAEGSLDNTSPPGEQSRRGTRLTLGPFAEPEEASGRLRAESQIEPWFARARNRRAGNSSKSDRQLEGGDDAEEDCSANTAAARDLGTQTGWADCPGQERSGLSDGEVYPYQSLS